MKFKQNSYLILLIFLFFGIINNVKAQEIPIQSEVLSNGIRIVYIADKTQTQNELFLFAKSQELIEPKKGISELTAKLLLGGIIGKTPSDWSDNLKKNQISIDYSDQIFSMKFSNSSLTEAVLLYSNLFQKNAYHAINFDKAKASLIAKNGFTSDSLSLIADNLSNKIAYGYPHPISFEINEAEINSITLQDCKSFVKNCYQPQNIVLVVFGNFNQKEIQMEIVKRFGTWKNEVETKLPNIKSSLPPIPNNYIMTPIPNGDSTIIEIKYPLDLILKEENHLPCKLLETIIENRFKTINGIGQIIEINIAPKRYVGKFEAKIKVPNLLVPPVLLKMEEVLNNIYLGRISEQDLQVAQNYLIKNSLFPDSKVAQIRTIIKETDASFTNILPGSDQVRAISLDQVKLMAYKFLKPKNLNVLIVGDLNFYYKELGDNYNFNIVNLKGNPIKWTPDIDKLNLQIQSNVLQNYIEKIGGWEKLQALKKGRINYTGEYLGKAIVVNQVFNKEQFLIEWFVNGTLLQKQVYDGSQFASFSFGAFDSLDTNSIKDILALSPIVPELYFEKNGVKIKETKIIKTNNIEEIELQLLLPSGKTVKQYFNKETGIKTSTRIPTNSYFGLSDQVINYSDYQWVNGFYLPNMINIKNENLRCNLILNSFDIDFLIESNFFSVNLDKE
jgi:hypothetical protein